MAELVCASTASPCCNQTACVACLWRRTCRMCSADRGAQPDVTALVLVGARRGLSGEGAAEAARAFIRRGQPLLHPPVRVLSGRLSARHVSRSNLLLRGAFEWFVWVRLTARFDAGSGMLEDFGTVRARPGRLRALSVFHSRLVFYGGFVWARRALKRAKRRFPARAERGAAGRRGDAARAGLRWW